MSQCLSVQHKLKHWIFIFLSGLSQGSLRVVSGLSQVLLTSYYKRSLKYFVWFYRERSLIRMKKMPHTRLMSANHKNMKYWSWHLRPHSLHCSALWCMITPHKTHHTQSSMIFIRNIKNIRIKFLHNDLFQIHYKVHVLRILGLISFESLQTLFS